MKSVIVLAMHGMTPKDFPADEKQEFLKLHSQAGSGALSPDQRRRHDALDVRIRNWPRTPANDTYQSAAAQLARDLERSSGSEVIVGYNEFCGPSLSEALAAAALKRPDQVVVVTPMMTRGGNHSEEQIPAEVAAAQKKFPHIRFEYAWPFDSARIAEFLTAHLRQF